MSREEYGSAGPARQPGASRAFRMITAGDEPAAPSATTSESTTTVAAATDAILLTPLIILVPRDALSRLTNRRANDGSPALSPDGSQIAFNSNRGGNLATFTGFGLHDGRQWPPSAPPFLWIGGR